MINDLMYIVKTNNDFVFRKLLGRRECPFTVYQTKKHHCVENNETLSLHLVLYGDRDMYGGWFQIKL